ncbi:MAG: xylulokinase, partial [Treponema sp.]|nr:xylulokinase [Treponema sp.]
LTGGGAKSPVWRQIVADILNLPVKVPVNSEAAAFGGALQALWCLETKAGKKVSMAEIADAHVELDESKTTMPIAENVAAYNKAYEDYKVILNQVSPLYV